MLADGMIQSRVGADRKGRATGLHQEHFNRLLDELDLLLQPRAFFDGNRTGDDRSGDPTGPS